MAKKILIADDEPDVLAVMERKLRGSGYLVTAVSNGREAVKSCSLDKPDLALLDIAMPDMDGYGIAEELNKDKELSSIPIIFITAKELNYKGMEDRLSKLGAYDYIRKPCDFQEILTKIKQAIG